MRGRAFLGFTALVVAGSTACQDPTQITVRVVTRGIPCGDGGGELGSTVLLSGPEVGDLKDIVPTDRCEARPGGAEVGDLIYIPRDDKDARFTMEVYMGLNDRSAEDCAVDCGADCIRASRRMSFVPHQKLLMTIVGDLACDGICCDDQTTCIDGACVSNEIEPCNEGDPGCGGQGGGGAGGASPTTKTSIIGAYDVVFGATERPHLVGHVDEGEHRTAFVATYDAPEAEPPRVRCVSDAGDVTMISAVPGEGRLYTLGTWEGPGTLTCDGDKTLQSPRPGNAFVLVTSIRNQAPRVFPVASWNADTTVDVADIAIVSAQQVVVVGYAHGEAIAIPSQTKPEVDGSGLLLVAFERSMGGGLAASTAQILATSKPIVELHAVGRLEQVGALVAARIDQGTLTFPAGGLPAETYGGDNTNLVLAFARSNFEDVSIDGVTVTTFEAAGAGGVALDGLGYYVDADDSDAYGTIALRHTKDLVSAGSLQLMGPNCTLVPMRVDGAGSPSETHPLGECDQILVGRSALGNREHLWAKRAQGSWSLGWPDIMTRGMPFRMQVSDEVELLTIYQHHNPSRIFVAGMTEDPLLPSAMSGVTSCSPSFVWGAGASRPFLRCFESSGR